MRLYELYGKAGYPKYSARVRDCATFLTFATFEGDRRKLATANFCKIRLCPMCIGRQARKNARKLSQVMDRVEADHPGVKFLFLTLTMENMDGAHLRTGLDQLIKGWYRLMDQRQIARSIRGWFRAIEITRGDGRRKADKGYHPHIHAILAVDADYFSRESRQSGKYLHQADLIQRWKKALRVDYDPWVDISTTKVRRRSKGVERATLAAAKEAAKYGVKDSEYIDARLSEDKAVEIVRDYTQALRRRRMMAFGGWLKTAAQALNVDNLDDDDDLVHIDEDDQVRPDVQVLLESYYWHFGAGDYILCERRVSALET